MIKIEVIVRPFAIEAVLAIRHEWMTGMTLSEVKGCGRQKGHVEIYRGAEYEVSLNSKLKIEMVIPEPLAPRILYELERALKTGKIGDGKIFTSRVEEAIRIRTGERGEDAL